MLAPYQDNRFKQATLRGDYDFGFATLTSLTGYSDLKMLASLENDGTPYNDTDSRRIDGTAKSFTQELRVANGSGNAFRWVIGGNYERTDVTEKTQVDYHDSTSTVVNGIVHNVYLSDARMRNIAGFANFEFDIIDQLTLKAGIRRTRAENKFYTTNRDDPDFPITARDVRPVVGTLGLSLTEFLNPIYAAIYGGRVPTIPQYASVILDTEVNPDGTPLNPATYLTGGAVNKKLVEHSTSWSLGIDFKPSDTLLFYLNASKGYKAGGFPHLSGSLSLAYNPVKQESLFDFEGGVKAQFFDRKLSINGAAFYYDYRNKQLRAKFVDPILGALDRLLNVPNSRITGAEIEVQARPLPGLSLSGSATYLNAQVRDYQGTIGSKVVIINGASILQAVTASFRGTRLPFAPKLQCALRADYDFAITDGLNAFLGAGINGQSKSIGILTVNLADQEKYKINARSIVGLNAGIHARDDSWRVSVWGKNVFNKYYWTNTIQTYDTIVRYAARPAEYGVTVGMKF